MCALAGTITGVDSREDEREHDEAQATDLETHQLGARLWARAHHEAAHAVVATLLGARVEEVAIWSGPPVSGRTLLTGLDDAESEPDQYGLVRRIVYRLAGPLAEQIAAGGPGMIMNEPASLMASALMAGLGDPASVELAPDLGAVVGLLVDHFGPDDEAGPAAAVDHMALNVENLVRERWSAVEQVAAGLLRHGRLTDDQLQSLFALALAGPPSSELLQALPPRSS
jgi:hypothetical protein